MAAESKRPFAHLTLLELLIGVTLLAVAGFFLVRGMQQAKEREQRQQLITALNVWGAANNDEEQEKITQRIYALAKANPKLHDARSTRGITPLHFAARHGNRDITQRILDHGADGNAKTNDGWTPLHYAAASGHKAIAELLLAKGADVHTKDNDGETPLHWAASGGRKEVAELLLAKGADINATDNDGKTPLDRTKWSGNQPLIELLLKHGAKE